MKFKAILVIAGGMLILACNKQDILPGYQTATAFNVTSKMTHKSDVIKATGDTIFITATGGIDDTSRKYSISANLKGADSVSKTVLAAQYVAKATVTFDTVGMSASKLYRWTTTIPFIIPPVVAKTKIQTTAVFNYSLGVSSKVGNQTATDSKYTTAQ